jgi:hypothetical protein
MEFLTGTGHLSETRSPAAARAQLAGRDQRAGHLARLVYGPARSAFPAADPALLPGSTAPTSRCGCRLGRPHATLGGTAPMGDGGGGSGWEPLEDLAGRGGRTRGPRLEAVPPLRRAEGSTAGSSGRGFGEGQRPRSLRVPSPGLTPGGAGPGRRAVRLPPSSSRARWP